MWLNQLSSLVAAGLLMSACAGSTPAPARAPVLVRTETTRSSAYPDSGPPIVCEARVSFATDSAALASEDRAELDRLAACLRSDPEMFVVIAGKADRRGPADYNLTLGAERAVAVTDYLRDRGVSRHQLRAITQGEARPVCKSGDAGCLARNRTAFVRF
jgi:outer membrane protein OmpA-like peptidoglycan-associated protein